MKESYYWDLIARHLSGNNSLEQEEELKDWINKDIKNKEVYELQKSLWNNSMPGRKQFEVDKAWNKLYLKINPAKEKNETSFRVLYRVAASLAIFIIISFVLVYFIHQWQNVIIVAAPSEQKIEIKLPDETTVWLNKNSTLKYKRNFGNENREVNLEGEAFFDVTPDKEKPFLIQTGKTVTQVIGTSFNVKEFNSSQNVEITVLTGKVEFYEKGKQKLGVSLLPGEKGIFEGNAGKLMKDNNEDSNFLAWKSGILKFDNADLHEAMQVIEEHYGTTIHLNPSLKNCKITTIFKNQPLDRVLMELHILLDIKHTRKNKEIILSGKGC